MYKQKLIVNFLISLIFLSLVSCDVGDDNNPSPIPDVRDKYIGEWNASDACSKGNYVVNISKDPSNSARVLLQNFANSKASQPDTAIVAANSLYLYQQVNSEGWGIEGAGDYQVDGTIGWVFKLIIGGSLDSCTATYEKGKS